MSRYPASMHGETYATALLAIAKWTTDVGVLWLTGACVFRGVSHRLTSFTTFRSDVESQLVQQAGLASSLLVLATLARLYAQTYSSFGLDEPVTSELLWLVAEQTRWGGRWVVQGTAVMLAACAAGAVVFRCRWSWSVLAFATLVVVATTPVTGHAFAYASGVFWPMVLQVGHLLAAGVWLGTLLLILVIGLRSSGQGSMRDAEIDGTGVLSGIVNRFSPVALTAAGVLAVTGLSTAMLYVDEWSQLWRTPYGRLLLVKGGLFGLTAMIGAYNWQKVRPILASPQGFRRLRYSATAELLVAAAVLAVTAWLVHLPMPHE
ncbi:MAG: CopD family protein [Acidobacteriota bacterium]|nr:CopD family protein [Acidobacteriota bacterium]